VSVQPFISTIAGTLDAKGRVCIPAVYRQILAAQNTSGIYVCPSFAEPALECFGQTLMDKTAERLAALDPFLSQLHDDLASQIVAESVSLPIDENGRIRLPDAMIGAAGLKERVLFVGLVQKFQIWDPETYAPIKEKRLMGARAARGAGTP
jgi:MraZ protein